MKIRSILLIAIIIIISVAVNAQTNRPLLNDLIREALVVSPKIKLLKAKFRVASSKIEQGTNLPDPILKFGLINMPVNSFSFFHSMSFPLYHNIRLLHQLMNTFHRNLFVDMK